jgi:hypothetical protein
MDGQRASDKRKVRVHFKICIMIGFMIYVFAEYCEDSQVGRDGGRGGGMAHQEVRNPCRILVRNRLGNMKVDKIYIKI